MRCVVLCVVVLLATPAVVSAQTDARFLIVPMVGIGPIRVGMSAGQVTSLLGSPTNTDQGPSGTVVYSWFERVGVDAYSGLYVTVTSSRNVIAVTAFYAPQYVTRNGLHTGVTEQDVREKMGAPAHIGRNSIGRVLIYPGIRFQLVEDPTIRGYGTVSQITVSG